MKDDSELWIVICGDPVGGFTHYGPFPSASEANEWADAELNNAGDWWCVLLEVPR